MSTPAAARIDLSFPHHWQAEILAARPLILPPRHFTYPRQADEIERGALEILIHPHHQGNREIDHTISPNQPAPGAPDPWLRTGESTNPTQPHHAPAQTLRAPSIAQPHRAMGGKATTPTQPSSAQSFLATCALGFRDPSLPTGVWSTPHLDEICAVAGGYAYLIDTRSPERFIMLDYRPVFAVLPAVAQGLLLFAGNRTILAWGANGQAWESPKLSDEGITITGIEGDTLHGQGWNLMSDKETPFALNLRSGDLQSAGSR
jgi:hypothetical protein